MTAGALLRSEYRKLPRSGAARVTMLGLAMGLLNGMLFLMSEQSIHTWRGIDAWHVLWTTFLSPLAIALLAGLTTVREHRARGGGTWWRPVSPPELRLAEFAWLVVLVLAMNGFVILAAIPFGLTARLPGSPPSGELARLGLTLAAASLAILALQLKLARALGLVMGMVTALLGTISGVALAERALWWLSPWAWPVRATLVLTGTHANGLPLAAGDPVWRLASGPPIMLSVLLSGIVLALPDARQGMSPARVRTGPERTLRRYPKGAWASEVLKQRHTALPWMTAITPVAFGLVAWQRHAALAVWQGWALLVLPFGAALTAALAWTWESEPWRTIRARPVSAERIYLVKLAVLWTGAAVSGLLLMVFTLSLGAPPRAVADLVFAQFCTAFLLLAIHLLVAVRFGSASSIALGLVCTLFAVILGGTGLGHDVWRFFPWIWGWAPVAAGVGVRFSTLALVLGGLAAGLGAYTAARGG